MSWIGSIVYCFNKFTFHKQQYTLSLLLHYNHHLCFSATARSIKEILFVKLFCIPPNLWICGDLLEELFNFALTIETYSCYVRCTFQQKIQYGSTSLKGINWWYSETTGQHYIPFDYSVMPSQDDFLCQSILKWIILWFILVYLRTLSVGDEVTGEREQLCDELCNMHTLPDIIWVTKSRRYDGHSM
jgi:hypothetical protein